MEWRCSRTYGWADGGSKFRTWDMISELGQDNSLPWLIRGDFNEILLAKEKFGGVGVDFNSLNSYRTCLELRFRGEG